jgi:hypothetical protein
VERNRRGWPSAVAGVRLLPGIELRASSIAAFQDSKPAAALPTPKQHQPADSKGGSAAAIASSSADTTSTFATQLRAI